MPVEDEHKKSEASSSNDAQPKKQRIDGVRDWLNAAGYPLEMRVARVFKAGHLTNIAINHVFATAAGLREIDIAAQNAVILHRPKRLNALFDLFAVCECKSNPKGNKSWLVFTDPTQDVEVAYRGDGYWTTELGRDLLDALAQAGALDAVPLFAAPRIGYAMKCATLGEKAPRESQNNHDVAYEAATSVITAAEAMSKMPAPGSYDCFRVVVPVIVVDTDLYECWLDRDSNLMIDQRDEMAVVWQHPDPDRPTLERTIVHVITEARLPSFVERIQRAHHELSRDEDLLRKLVHQRAKKQSATKRMR